MRIKHKLLSDYQYTSVDKKIFLIKTGTIIEEYVYKLNGESIFIDKDIIQANPQIFSIIDWKMELLSYMKVNKMPQPAQLGKKLIPFIEEMVLSTVSQSSGTKLDDSKIKELEEKETKLFKEEQNIQRIKISFESREKLIKDKEDEIEVRLKRLEKKESEYKLDIENIDKKEEEIRNKNKEIKERELDVEDKLQDINERERNLDLNALKSSEEIDLKYSELQSKMKEDLKKLSDGEKDLEIKLKEFTKKENSLQKIESEFDKKWSEINSKVEELNLFKEELDKLNAEIKSWESLHWKFKRNIVPPSALPETKSTNFKLL